MIVKYSTLSNLEVPKFTLCNPGSVYNNGFLSKVVGILVDHEAEEIVFNFNSTSELNLRVNRVTREDPEENTYIYRLYKSIQNRRLIFVEDIGFFMITGIDDGYDGATHYKDVKAQSIDIELAQKMIPFIENGTYRFCNDEEGINKGILETIVETLPLWTIGYVDESVANKWRTFEDVDTSLNCQAFLLENVQDAYECIIIFDCITRTINVYAQDNYVKQTNIHITKDDLINSLDISENADDLYTAISVLGNDDVTISAVNPLGTNVIYNFDYYLDWMTEQLRDKVISWQEAVKNKEEEYRDIGLRYYTNLGDASNIQMEIDKIDAQLKIYNRCKDNIVAYDSTDIVASYNTAIAESGGQEIDISASVEETLANINSLIAECESERDFQLSKLYSANTGVSVEKEKLSEIQQELSLTNRFTADEYQELCHYIFEGSYTDEYVTITDIMTYEEKFEQMKVLYDRAKSRLDRVSKPSQEFNIDVQNFVFVKEFAEWSEQLETGCLINVELDTNDIALLFLSNITINYDDKTLNMTFGNRFNKFDPKSLFDDMLGDISKSANTLNYIKEILYPIKNGEFNSMKEALQTSRNLTMGASLSSTNEEVIIDGSGYTGRRLLETGGYDPRQVKITGRNIVFTDDAWETCKLAIGEILSGDGGSAYGINAEAIIGDVIVGNNLCIKDKDGTDIFTVVDEKIESRVNGVEGTVSTIQQFANALGFKVDKIEKTDIKVDSIITTTGYTFNADGLTIYKSGEEIKNLLDNTGMYVTRAGGGQSIDEEILTANNNGVRALNLTAKQYLIIGDHSRFEDYLDDGGTKRTACFYISE